MRQRLCNGCHQWSRVDEWDFGCPTCAHTNGRGEVSYSEFPGVEVMPDIPAFKSPSGVVIEGRAQWREHLKATDSIEMGHSDVKSAQAVWGKKKEAYQDRLKGSAGIVKQWSDPDHRELDRPVQRSNLAVEMANRLHNRPIPDRKTMIKITLDEMKRINRGR
jgi:hypothetical protein